MSSNPNIHMVKSRRRRRGKSIPRSVLPHRPHLHIVPRSTAPDAATVFALTAILGALTVLLNWQEAR